MTSSCRSSLEQRDSAAARWVINTADNDGHPVKTQISNVEAPLAAGTHLDCSWAGRLSPAPRLSGRPGASA